MKKAILILFLISLSTYSQVAEYGKISKKGNFKKYISKDGHHLKIGDTLTLGMPNGQEFNYITQSGQYVRNWLANKTVKISKIKSYGNKNRGFQIYILFKGYGLVPVMIDFENALLAEEVKI